MMETDMQDLPVVSDSLPASRSGTSRRRTRTATACSTCRARRTRCDSRKPDCGFCRARGLQCHYEQSEPAPTSKVGVELAAINRRLDHITSSQVFTGEEKLPFQLLGTGCMMTILGLGPGFAEELATLERHAASIGTEQALSALAAFSAHVHIWYPILRPRFSERYLGIISGSLPPGSETCMVLLVAALGVSSRDETSELYLEAAMASLPAVLIDKSVESVQCLVLLSIYHCCLSKPSQAYDYAMIASFKVQNLLKYVGDDDGEVYEHAKRAYWAVLLLESELRIHFDVIGSGIWDHDDKVSLPDSRPCMAVRYRDRLAARLDDYTSQQHITRRSSYRPDAIIFLAEISMRRMLHRCNTAIRRTHRGEIVYAPNIALELELQLEEWYRYLPESVRFQNSEHHCEMFFQAYIQLMPSLLICIRNCIVNRWTLYGSIFMTSMAVIQAARTPCLGDGCVVDWPRLLASPSLSLMESALAQRLTEIESWFHASDKVD
ncbi:hypothetical protein B0J15DRAFT_491208 [Fusarium solani]|uniref:Zn(2)-C6 fungal-type domain-containing protein n=1 Tax=Fusarium solani TaxID=169388 RepID=A0A9P9HW01_FUSSL|nr:uncharacterized protein B0J15DRAFT_491208 [Fusarium solani]KAH7264670.1 hypothetical protein B0J15DRAFT_491208 [Fusarium solani]